MARCSGLSLDSSTEDSMDDGEELEYEDSSEDSMVDEVLSIVWTLVSVVEGIPDDVVTRES